MSAPKPLAAKKLTISVVDEDGKKHIIEYEGRIFLQYTIQHDVGPIDGRRRVLSHLGGFSINLSASGTDERLHKSYLQGLEEAHRP